MDNRELYHYGILGMKWGVRRYQNKDGSLTPEGKKRDITRVSARKVKKQMAKLENDSERRKYTDAAETKTYNKVKKTKEYKDFENANKVLYELDAELKRQKGPHAQLVVDKNFRDEYNKLGMAYEKKVKEFIYNDRHDIASAMLKDLGYEDTQAGREYLIEIYGIKP
jgi:hypothetical protein